MVEEFAPGLIGMKGMPDLDSQSLLGSRDVVDNTWKLINNGKKSRERVVKNWPKWHALYSSNHWEKARPEWMSEPVINLTFSTIETILPILTDNRPQISVVPWEPDDIEIAKVISMCVEAVWDLNDADIILPKVMKDTLIFGNGFIKVGWDPALRGGLGDIAFYRLDPENVVVDPNGSDDASIEWIAHVQNVPISYIEKNPIWAQFANQIKPGEFDKDFTVDRNSQPSSKNKPFPTRFSDTTGAKTYDFVDGPPRGVERDKMVTLAEVWKKEYDEFGGYYIRKIVVANDTLLEDGPSPLSRNFFPIVHFIDYPVGWEYWAMGEPQQVEQLQYDINKRRGMMIDILKFTASPMLVIDPSSGVDWENIQTRPGLIIPALGGPGSVAWLHPPSMPGELFAMNDRDKQDFDSILGNVDVLQGRRPVGVEAAAAIEALTEAANTRMRLKVRFMEASLRQLGRLVVSMIQQFYNTHRIIRIAGRDSDGLIDAQLDFMEVNAPQGIDESGQPVLQNPIPVDAEFDVKIGAGSTLPVSRQSRFSQALQLFQVGAIDQIELLKHSAWPRFEEVVARMQMMQAQQLQAQQAMAQAQPA